ncbi:MAG: hypothetical protein FD134_862 [Gallionellaceae bacterium]|nr:MAG: hypothetical protein FD134_862 [Gallionellaceae bacterium]
MLKLIKNARDVAVDQWKTLTLAEGETPHSVRLPAGPVLVPLSVWRARRAELLHSEYEHGWPLGVWLAEDEHPELIEGDLDDFTVVAIKPGALARDKSHEAARFLRERHSFKGELLAAA